MRRSYEHQSSSYYREVSWSSTHEYLERFTKTEVMPSIIITDFPRFPDIHEVLSNNNSVYVENPPKRTRHRKHQAPEVQQHRKAHLVEPVKASGMGSNGKQRAYEDRRSIDALADGFIQEKRRNFELCK